MLEMADIYGAERPLMQHTFRMRHCEQESNWGPYASQADALQPNCCVHGSRMQITYLNMQCFATHCLADNEQPTGFWTSD